MGGGGGLVVEIQILHGALDYLELQKQILTL